MIFFYRLIKPRPSDTFYLIPSLSYLIMDELTQWLIFLEITNGYFSSRKLLIVFSYNAPTSLKSVSYYLFVTSGVISHNDMQATCLCFMVTICDNIVIDPKWNRCTNRNHERHPRYNPCSTGRSPSR